MAFSFFRSAPFHDPALGELRRKRGAWRGSVRLDGRDVPLVIRGGRNEPEADMLAAARSLPGDIGSWKLVIERELFEHYAPYAEAVAANEEDPPVAGLPKIDSPADVWAHTTPVYVLIERMRGVLTFEIGYRAAWDEEHTLGARFQNGRWLELNGSVLEP